MPFNRLNHTVLGEIRPRFVLELSCELDTAFEKIQKDAKIDSTVSVVHSNNLLFIQTPLSERHYWSPEMTVRIEKSEYTGKVFVNCLLGPRQAVWAMFTLIYAAILLLSIFGGMFGLVQWQTSGSSIFVWFLPVGLILFLSVFLFSKIGQQKGRDQMLHLVSFVYHSLADISSIQRVEKR